MNTLQVLGELLEECFDDVLKRWLLESLHGMKVGAGQSIVQKAGIEG